MNTLYHLLEDEMQPNESAFDTIKRLKAERNKLRETLEQARLLIRSIARPGVPLAEIRLSKMHAQFHLQECRRFLNDHPDFNQPGVAVATPPDSHVNPTFSGGKA